MKKVETRLDEATIAKIQLSGKSIYEFLAEAVALKLENNRALDINDALDRRLKEFESRVLSNIEERIVEGVRASKKILEDAVGKDESFRERINESLRKISGTIKGA